MSAIKLQNDDIIRRFAILEESLNFEYTSEIIIPQDLISDNMDMPEFNKIAKFLMSCFGFQNVIPICGFSEEKKGTAGHTEYIDEDKDGVIKMFFPIVINIGRDAIGNPERILAIFVHEICHNVLRLNNFPILNGLENEIYTDLATIYLGLGKYTLRGHKYIKTKKVNLGFQINYETNTSTIGYLTEDTYNRAYILNQIFRGYNDYSDLSKDIVRELKDEFNQSQCRNFRHLLSKKEGRSSKYNDVFKVSCPKCGCISVKPQAKFYGKLIRCNKCGHIFNFEWKFPLKENKGAWVHFNSWFYEMFMI